MLDRSVNLIALEKWLNENLKSMFDPLADIISNEEEKLKYIKKVLSKAAQLILKKKIPLKITKLKLI